VYIVGKHEPSGYRARYSFYNYTMFARAARSFRGVGPSLSWNASAALLGNRNAGELTFDWGINGAVLFGRQKTKTNHTTQAYHLPITQRYGGAYDGYYYTRVPQKSHQGSRVASRSVVVPNFGGFAGVSVKYPNIKVSLGYRADMFFGAMDTGIDTAKRMTTGFYGPFASVGIGL
jgi:iron complex outermembrane receptor protein